MKALVKKAKGKGQIELLDTPIPQVKEGYVLLLKMENVIFSLHMGFYSEESINGLNQRTAESVADVLLENGQGLW